MAIIRKITVTGRVQGVWFRAFTREAACRHRISGWVKNMPDGSVQCLARGSEKDMQDFLQELHTGPERSRVDSVTVEPYTGEENFTTFSIHY